MKQLKANFDEVSCDELYIGDQSYLNIKLGNDNEKSQRIINPPMAIERCMDTDNLYGILSHNRVNCGPYEKEVVTKVYEVLIFDMKIIFIRQKVAGKSGIKTKYMRENQKITVSEKAKKVLLLSGVDFALITMVLTNRRGLKVTEVNPCPRLRDKDLNSLLEIIDKIYHQRNKEVKLGADPEFMIINRHTGKVVSASSFFPNKGMVGCDNIRMPNRQQRPVAELRPRPDKSPLQLVANIKYALIRASSMAPYYNLRWVGGSQPVPGYSIGGHIHFSNLELNAALIRALDNYIGIPVFLLEKPVLAAKRRKKYGFLCDYREKDYGGFEYRTPGSWLVSQKIATAVICLAKIVSSNYLQLSNNYLNLAESQQAFYSGDRNYFINEFKYLWNDLQNTDLYEKYAEEIEIIYWMISNDIQWDEKMDIRKGWKITTGSKRNNSRTALENSRSAQDTNINEVQSGVRRNRSSERRNPSSFSSVNSTERTVHHINNPNRNLAVSRNQTSNSINSRGRGVQTGRIISTAGVHRAIMVS